jgi:hypothetical protein
MYLTKSHYIRPYSTTFHQIPPDPTISHHLHRMLAHLTIFHHIPPCISPYAPSLTASHHISHHNVCSIYQ